MSANTPPFTQEYLKSILDYNPDMGIFTWKVRNDVKRQNWNTRYVGTRAGRLSSANHFGIRIHKKHYLCSTLAWFYMKGEWLSFIDHKDRNSQNDVWTNLREATRSQNQCNRNVQINNTSGYKGVCWHKTIRKWVVRVKVQGKQIFGGYFTSKEEAYAKYCELAIEYYGEFAYLPER